VRLVLQTPPTIPMKIAFHRPGPAFIDPDAATAVSAIGAPLSQPSPTGWGKRHTEIARAEGPIYMLSIFTWRKKQKAAQFAL
jgi:hypothetical protein